MEKIQLTRIAPGRAAELLAGLERLDPAGTTTPAGISVMAAAGQCFAARRGQDSAVYVVRVSNGTAWISACQGSGSTPWRRALLPVIEQQAAGCEAVAFQTARPGLVREAVAQGYEVAGWILRKKL